MSLKKEKIPQGDRDDIEITQTQPVSEYLKECRTNKKIDIATVSQVLRIRHDYIVALEDGNVKLLPERVYTLGFVRAYARLLELDIDETLRRFKLEILGDPKHPVYSLPIPINENTRPRRWLVVFSGIISLMIFAGWFFFLNQKAPSDKKPEIPMEIQRQLDHMVQKDPAALQAPVDFQKPLPLLAEPAPEQTSLNKLVNDRALTSSSTEAEAETVMDVKTTAEMKPAEAKPEIKVIKPDVVQGTSVAIVESTWIEIKDMQGKIVEKRLFQPGDTFPTFAYDVTLTVGNASGVRLIDQGQEKNLGASGEVIRGYRLKAKTS